MEVVVKLVNEYSHHDTDVGAYAGELNYEIQFLSEFIRIIFYEDTGFLVIGVDTDAGSEFPSLLADCYELLQ